MYILNYKLTIMSDLTFGQSFIILLSPGQRVFVTKLFTLFILEPRQEMYSYWLICWE